MSEVDYTQRRIEKSAIDALGVAWRWMGTVLFKPFGLKKWCLLGLIGFAMSAYEVFFQGQRISFQLTLESMGDPRQWFGGNAVLLVAVIIIGVVVFLGIYLLMIYVAVRCQFVYLYSIAKNKVLIRRGWYTFREQANSLFFWTIILGIALIVIIAIPMAIAVPLLVLGHFAGILVFLGALLLIMLAALIGGFVVMYIQGVMVPIMYVKRVNFIRAFQISRQFWKKNIGRILLFLLFHWLTGIVIGVGVFFIIVVIGALFALPVILIIALTTGFRDLTLAVFLPWLPALAIYFALAFYVYIVALQPAQVFIQSYRLAFVEGFGDDFRMLGVKETEPFDYDELPLC